MSKKKKSVEELLEETLIPKEEQPYPIPQNWVWVKLGKVVGFIGGGTPSKSEQRFWNGNIPWATVKDIKGIYLSKTIDSITEEGLNNSSSSVANPSELLLVTRMSPGKSAITQIQTTINQDLKIVRPKIEILPFFLWLYFTVNMPLIESLSTGSTVKGIQVAKLNELQFPLPPLNEQKRIVNRVERLLNKIKEAKQLIEEAKETFELRRAAILDKAFRGKLGTNNPLEYKPLVGSIYKDEIPYEVPENWAWVKLNGCLQNIQYGYTESSSSKEIGPKFLRITDIQDDDVVWSGVPYCKITNKELKKYQLFDKDIVVARTGATTGKSYLIKNPPVSVFASYLIRLRTNLLLDSKYLWKFMKSPFYWQQITVVKKGSAQPGANAKILGDLLIPLPPLDEQKRIAEKVEQILNKMSEEKKLISRVEEQLNDLKQSILSKAFRGQLGTNDPTEESAIELLKEVLSSN